MYGRAMPYRDREQQRAYQREWMRRRREAWFAENSPCVDCGSGDRLELDHRDPDQKVDHCVWSWKEERRLAELAKCVVRCHDCHKIKSLQENLRRGHPDQKLTAYDVQEIRRRRNTEGETVRSIARDFGMDSGTISRIARGLKWKYVPM